MERKDVTLDDVMIQACKEELINTLVITRLLQNGTKYYLNGVVYFSEDMKNLKKKISNIVSEKLIEDHMREIEKLSSSSTKTYYIWEDEERSKGYRFDLRRLE